MVHYFKHLQYLTNNGASTVPDIKIRKEVRLKLRYGFINVEL